MALSKKEMEIARQAEREHWEERAKAYETAKKEEQDLIKKRIKNGQLTAAEEKKLEEARQKRRDNYDAWWKKKKADTDKAAKDAQDEIDIRIEDESAFHSFATTINNNLHKARMAGNKELEGSLENLQGKTFAVAEAEAKIGTSKYTNIDYSTELATLEKKRINLIIEMNRAIESGDTKAIEAVQRKIDANDEETKGIQILHDKGKIMNRQNEILTNGLKPLEDMKDKMEKMAMTLELMVANPMFLFVALAAALAAHFVKTEESFEKFRKDMGITNSEFTKFRDTALAVSNNMADIGVSLDDALGATESLIKEFGDMGIASERNVETVLRMNKALGLTNDEATKFLKAMSSIQGGSIETAEALAAQATNMARVAGVAPQAVIEDMTANADNFAGYIKDGGKNLAEAAVFAAKMGASVQQMVNMADHLLDIEASTEAMMEAQVLTGRSINLEKARQMALNNDIKGMGEEILKQVGTEAEWNKMNKIQRDAMAKAMGMTTAEMGNMISKQESLKKLQDGSLSTQEALAKLPLSEVMDAKGITGPITDIKNSIKAIAVNLMEVFRPVFNFIAPIIKTIAWGISLVAKLLNNPVAKGILYLWMMWKLINSELVFGYALKVKDFIWWMGAQIKKKAMMLWEFAWDKKNWSWKLAKQKLFGGLQANLHKKEMLRKKAEQSLDAKGWKAKIKGMKDRIMGKGAGTKPDASPSKAGGAVSSTGAQGKGTGSIMKSVGKIDFNKVLKGAAAMIIVAGALFIFAKALQELPTEPAPYIGAAVGLGMLMLAVLLMGKMQGQLIKGSVAMLLMGAAFLPFAFGLSLIADVSWGAVIAAAGALVIFTAAIFGLGALMMSGVGAMLFGAGIVAFALLGATMIIFGAGLMVVATAASLLSESMSGVAVGLTELVASSDGIFSLALGLGALALGFISLAGSLMILMPFLPLLLVLGASGVIGQVLGTAEPAEGGGDGGGKEKKQSQASKDRERMVMLLEQILEKVSTDGVVKLDGKKVGEVLGGGAGVGPLVG